MNDHLTVVWERADAREPRFSGDEVAAWDDGLADRLTAAGVVREIENATSVVCDACADEHDGEVIFIKSPHGTPVRAYIPCPEHHRVSVPLHRLRQWEVDFGGLAGAIHRGLELAGNVEEIVPSRIWLLGKATVAAQLRELFLTRGLTWEDARNVLGESTRLNAARSAIVLAAGDVPPESVWNGDAPPVFPLKALTALGGAALEIDRLHLESLMSTGRKKTPDRPLVSFPTPDGATWADVRFIVTEDRLRIEVKGKRKDYTFQEAGFEEGRKKGVPDRLWTLLKLFGMHGGILPYTAVDQKLRTKLKQYVSEIRQRLAALLPGIDSDPIAYDKEEKSYQTAFKITCEDALQFPTPAGASWTDVSIARQGDTDIRISVTAIKRFAAPDYTDKDDASSRRWIAAEQEGAVARTYDLRSLGLSDEADRPTRAGEVLLSVLAEHGALKRDADDKGMLELCGVLSNLMGLDGSPFRFAEIDEKWVALFEATDSMREWKAGRRQDG